MRSSVIDFHSAAAFRCLTGRTSKGTTLDGLDEVARKVLGVMMIAAALVNVSGVRAANVEEAQVIAADALLDINAIKHYPFLPLSGSERAGNPNEVLDSSRRAVIEALGILQSSMPQLPCLAPLLDLLLCQGNQEEILVTIVLGLQAVLVR